MPRPPDMMGTGPPTMYQALTALARFALLAAVAVLALRYVDLGSLTEFRPATGLASPGGTDPAAAPFLVSDFRRIPCVMKSRKGARVRPLNTAIDQLGP